MAFSPDNSHIAIGHTDGSITLWDINMQTLLEKACLIVGRNMSLEEVQVYLQSDEQRETCPGNPPHPDFHR